MRNLEKIKSAVQHNCDLADASHAGDYTMCTYLLKMREFYRWSAGIAQTDPLSSEDVTSWVQKQENYWLDLQNDEYQCIELSSDCLDPFDVEMINATLIPDGLVYSAGYGRGCRPMFFLGELLEQEVYEGYQVLIAAQEYARDLPALPAMAQNKMILVRFDSIRRMVWDAIEAWRWRKSPQDSTYKALSYYDFDNDEASSLNQMSSEEVESAIYHEIGEITASELLGDDWKEMLMGMAGTRMEFIARAVKDHLSDAMVTLPALIETGSWSSLHFYFSRMDPLRREMSPQVDIAYSNWCDSGELMNLVRLINKSRTHWLEVAEQMMQRYFHSGKEV
ncbi:MAG: hypothetical protein EP297_07180, partial [Gammaproteobacteria bacterium]